MDKVINGQEVNAILIQRKYGYITINVSVEPFSVTEKEVRITTKDILLYLKEKNIEVGGALKSSVISNRSANSLLGTWEFQVIPDKSILLELANQSKMDIEKKEDEVFIEELQDINILPGLLYDQKLEKEKPRKYSKKKKDVIE